jgi:hypothetical protein
MAKSSWANIVRGGPPVVEKPKPVIIKPPPKVSFYAFCADCGAEAGVCKRCDKWAVYLDGLCGCCYAMSIPSDWMCKGYADASREAHKIPFKCDACRKVRPWRWEDDKEIVSYSYERGCFCHPLSPTNVIRIARYRLASGTTPEQREAEARAAYEKEMKFSGDKEEAEQIYKSFFEKKIEARIC